MVPPEVMMCRREHFVDSSALYTADWNTEGTSKRPQRDKNKSKVRLTLWRLLSDSLNRKTGMHCWHYAHVICVIRRTHTV